VVLTIYFLVDLPRLRRSVVRLFPRAHRDRFALIADVMVDKVGSCMIENRDLPHRRRGGVRRAHAAAPGDGETAPQPGQGRTHAVPPRTRHVP
jgi:hypothetical protein